MPGRWMAAAAGPDRVWCVAGGRLLAFSETGAPQLDHPISQEVRSLAATATSLVVALDSSSLAWLDPSSGRLVARRPAGGALELLSGGGGIWAIDRSAARAWRVGEQGALGPARAVAAIDRAAADGDRLWWTTATDTRLHGFERTVDIGVTTNERSGMVVCAGSVWISVIGGLCRVGTWGSEKGPLLAAPMGPVPFLTCAGGVLVGAARQDRLFALDPSADADLHVIETATGGPVGALVAVGHTAWLFPEGHAEARLVPV